MDQPIALVALQCLKCGEPVEAAADETAWACRQCGQGLALDEAMPQGLSRLDIHYAASLKPGRTGRPFWVAEGRVTVARETYGGNRSREAEAFWQTPRRFFVPAFACDLETMLNLGRGLLRQPPALTPGAAAPFQPVTVSQRDVRPLAEFIVVGVEADRSDKLKTISCRIDLDTPELWILPDV